MKLNLIHKSILLGLVGLSACTQSNIRESFYQGRACAEIKYQCLKQENNMAMPPTEVYILSDAEEKRIQQDEMTRMYRENNLMLEVYYPGFWDGVTDEKVKLDWMKTAHNIARKYSYPDEPSDGRIAMMAHICAIIGLDFETNPKYQFIVNKLNNSKATATKISSLTRISSDIINYLRFEVLQKDYNVGGYNYNTWSLRGVQDGMPPITRSIPDFYKVGNFYNAKEDVRAKYNRILEQGEK